MSSVLSRLLKGKAGGASSHDLVLEREREKAREARHRRMKDTIIAGLGAIIILAVLLVSLYVLTRENVPAEQMRWAQHTLTMIVGVILGYLFRGRVQRP